MNFPPFGGHFSTAIPTIHQFAAKFTTHQDNTTSLCPTQEQTSNRYTANGVPSFTQHHPATTSQQQMLNTSKYQGNYMNQTIYGHQTNLRHQDKRQSYEHQQELAQELCVAMLQQQQQEKQADKKQEMQQQQQQQQQQQENERRNQQNSPHQQQHTNHQQLQTSQPVSLSQNQGLNTAMPTAWQSLATPGSTVADYLSHLPASTLPLSLHHFLKYSAENIKKETQLTNLQNGDTNLNLLHNNTLNLNGLHGNGTASVGNSANGVATSSSTNTLTGMNSTLPNTATSTKKKKKKKVEKEKKPRPKPGEIRLTTALDGSTLYCCPECHMAYPEKELLEQHLVGHTLERRFVCDICGAGLKRKDHLTRHKQSHNPERPYVCTVCLKAFKRKEQLTLHFVIHSGEKRHICTECGKGFYRKDHLRKHTRSHIARRVKAELSQQGNNSGPSLQLQVAAPTTSNSGGIMS